MSGVGGPLPCDRFSAPPHLQPRGYHAVYRENEPNHCPNCGRSHWWIGRLMAECGFCKTALPLASGVIAGGVIQSVSPPTMASTAPSPCR